MEKNWVVDVLEYERGWGHLPMYSERFDTWEKAAAHKIKFNSGNTSEEVPENYFVAKEPYYDKGNK